MIYHVRGLFSALSKFCSEGCEMRVRASVKALCRNCKVVRRRGVVRIICTDPRHKQRQG